MIESRTVALAGAPASSPKTEAPAAKEARSGPGFGEVLRAIGEEARRGEALVERAVRAGRGGDLSAGDLLALQAGIYRWVEVVDLASKLVDRTAQAAKTVTQGSGG
jgi:hypothetical protein